LVYINDLLYIYITVYITREFKLICVCVHGAFTTPGLIIQKTGNS